MRLDVGVLGAEEGARPIPREPLHPIDELASPVVATARQAFGVFVREDRRRRFEDRGAYEILGSDQLEPFLLAADLVVDRLGDLGVGREQGIGRGCHARLSSCFHAGSRGRSLSASAGWRASIRGRRRCLRSGCS